MLAYRGEASPASTGSEVGIPISDSEAGDSPELGQRDASSDCTASSNVTCVPANADPIDNRRLRGKTEPPHGRPRRALRTAALRTASPVAMEQATEAADAATVETASAATAAAPPLRLRKNRRRLGRRRTRRRAATPAPPPTPSSTPPPLSEVSAGADHRYRSAACGGDTAAVQTISAQSLAMSGDKTLLAVSAAGYFEHSDCATHWRLRPIGDVDERDSGGEGCGDASDSDSSCSGDSVGSSSSSSCCICSTDGGGCCYESNANLKQHSSSGLIAAGFATFDGGEERDLEDNSSRCSSSSSSSSVCSGTTDNHSVGFNGLSRPTDVYRRQKHV